MTAKEHRELLSALEASRAMVALSGYDNQMYARLERNGWSKVSQDVACFSKATTRETDALGQGRQRPRRKEMLWLNPACRRNLTQMSLFEVEGVEAK
jgi:hypothetical protein